jgi:hypothetical protein
MKHERVGGRVPVGVPAGQRAVLCVLEGLRGGGWGMRAGEVEPLRLIVSY